MPYVDTTSYLTLKDPPSHVYVLSLSENTVMYLFLFSEVLTSTNEFPEKFRFGLYALWEVILIEVRFTFIFSLILFQLWMDVCCCRDLPCIQPLGCRQLKASYVCVETLRCFWSHHPYFQHVYIKISTRQCTLPEFVDLVREIVAFS